MNELNLPEGYRLEGNHAIWKLYRPDGSVAERFTPTWTTYETVEHIAWGPSSCAVIIINRRGDALHDGHRVLWRGLAPEIAEVLCSDGETAGDNFFLAWIDEYFLADTPKKKQPQRWHWYWAHDDGRFDHLLELYGLLESVERRGG